MLCYEQEFYVDASGVELFAGAIAIFLEVKAMVSGLSAVICLSLCRV